MKSKMMFLIKQSLKKKIKTKWFLAVNIILGALIIGLANIDKIINYFGGDFEDSAKIYVVDKANSYDKFEIYFDTMAQSVGDFGNYELIQSKESLEELKNRLSEDKDKSVVVEINISTEEYLTSILYSYNPIDVITYQLLTGALNATKSEYALESTGINPAELAIITAPANVSVETLNPDLNENAEAKDLMANIVIVIFIVPFFLLVVMLVQMLGAEINDEKTTRSMEIIISNVSPKTHFFSKIIAATGFVLIQAFLFLFYTCLGLLVRYLISGGIGLTEGTAISDGLTSIIEMLKNTGILNSLMNALVLIILILILNLFAFALLAGILASMTTSTEDFQQLQAPLMIICVAGYYLAFMATYFEGATFIKIFSYLPFFSAMVAPVLYLLGQSTIIELGLSVLFTGIACFLLFYFGLRVYKVGILNYSSKDLWKKVFKSIKQKN